jgi:hypothetical protein
MNLGFVPEFKGVSEADIRKVRHRISSRLALDIAVPGISNAA